jgi:hypothetical protein
VGEEEQILVQEQVVGEQILVLVLEAVAQNQIHRVVEEEQILGQEPVAVAEIHLPAGQSLGLEEEAVDTQTWSVLSRSH